MTLNELSIASGLHEIYKIDGFVREDESHLRLEVFNYVCTQGRGRGVGPSKYEHMRKDRGGVSCQREHSLINLFY